MQSYYANVAPTCMSQIQGNKKVHPSLNRLLMINTLDLGVQGKWEGTRYTCESSPFFVLATWLSSNCSVAGFRNSIRSSKEVLLEFNAHIIIKDGHESVCDYARFASAWLVRMTIKRPTNL